MPRMRGALATTWWAWAFLFGRGAAQTAVLRAHNDVRLSRRAAWVAYFDGMTAVCAGNAADCLPFSRRPVAPPSPADTWLCSLSRASRLASKLTEAETDWCADLVVRQLVIVDNGVVKITSAGKARSRALGVLPVYVRQLPGPTTKDENGVEIEEDLAPPLPPGDVAPYQAPPPPKAPAARGGRPAQVLGRSKQAQAARAAVKAQAAVKAKVKTEAKAKSETKSPHQITRWPKSPKPPTVKPRKRSPKA